MRSKEISRPHASSSELASLMTDPIKNKVHQSSVLPVLVGVCGVPGSGKTSFSEALVEQLSRVGLRALALTYDGFHLSRNQLQSMADSDPTLTYKDLMNRRGSPKTFNGPLALETFQKLKQREGTFVFPTFNHSKKDPEFTQMITPKNFQVIIVEGLYTFLGDVQKQFKDDYFCNVEPGTFPSSIYDIRIGLFCDREVAEKRVLSRNAVSVFDGNEAAAAEQMKRNDVPNGDFVEFLLSQIDLDYALFS